MRRRGLGIASDERILGGGEFVERVIEEAEAKERETLRLSQKVEGLSEILREAGEKEGIDEGAIRTVRRSRRIVKVIKLFCQLAVRRYGYTGASVARFLGVTTSLVNRYAAVGDV